jgi:hypothetical protein
VRGGGAVGRAWEAIRLTWEALWTHPAIFNLAFWALMLLIVVDWVAVARVVPLLPKNFANVVAYGSTAALNHLSRQLTAAVVGRVAIFGLAVLFIVTPFRIGGLYGGAWKLTQAPPRTPAPLQFFVSGTRLFWRGMAVTLWGLALLVALLALDTLLGTVLGGTGEIVGLVVTLWALGGAWCALGWLMAEPERPSWEIVWTCLGLALRRWGDLLSLVFLLGVLLLAATLVLSILIRIPLIGLLAVIVALGVMLGFMAAIPFVLYQNWLPAGSRP